MKKIYLLIVMLLLGVSALPAQEAGNRAYGTQRRRPLTNSGVLIGNTDVATRVYYVEANVMMNVKADGYVALFGIVQEAPTAAESNAKLDAQIAGFIKELEGIGIKRGDTFVDFITQNKIYDYTANGSTVTEKFSGFETKKNVAVRYKDRALLEQVLSVATRLSIYDLIEVDYVVNDIPAVHTRLFDEAVKVIKQKEAGYASSFGVKLLPANFANEKYDAFYPADLYANYQAFEAGSTYGDYNNRVVQQRKTRTFYYVPLDASDFDSVINQMGIEPMVQFTLYLRMQYELAGKK